MGSTGEKELFRKEQHKIYVEEVTNLLAFKNPVGWL